MLYAEVSCKLNLPNRKSYHILNGSEWFQYLGSLINMKYSLSLLKDWVFSFYSNLTLKDNQGAKRSPPVNLGMFEENKLEMKKQMLSNFRHVLLKIVGPTRLKMKGGPEKSIELIYTQVSVTVFFLT